MAKNSRPRTLPRRGQVKAAIFASIFASIARFLRPQAPAEVGNGARSSNSDTRSGTRMSDFGIDASQYATKGLGLSAESLPSSPASMSSGTGTPPSPFELLLTRSGSFDETGRRG